MTKRALPVEASRRVKPTLIEDRPLTLTNIQDGETVHQACIILNGQCQQLDYSAEQTSYISVTSASSLNRAETVHHWPVHHGEFKALVMLNPGLNKISFKIHHGSSGSLDLTITYIPLLQLPPLHLAILVAKDSPLLTDCPPAKYGGISTAHSGIDAAISKLRMAAYMWQALTAEDFRQKGLGRRSFRLEEEWALNTTTRAAHQAAPGDHKHMGSVAKVHIIRSEKTVEELRDVNCAQQNSSGHDRDALHRYFETALLNAGAPFQSGSRPVVAGLVLDAHYSAEKGLILAHAALGCHKPNGLSLGIFGSHLTYSWPRFVEEVPACLEDLTLTGDTVGNDNGECDTMRGACFVGQGAFLHEVGHAFGADHTTGIMARGYSKSWGLNFLAPKDEGRAMNEAKWDLQDVFRFKLLPHFALPGDEPVTLEFKNATINGGVENDQDIITEADSKALIDGARIKISSAAGLAQVKIWSGNSLIKTHDFTSPTRKPSLSNLPKPAALLIDANDDALDRDQPLKIIALAQNGKERTFTNAWSLFKQTPFIRIPGSDIVLSKQSARSDKLDSDDPESFFQWALLLNHRGHDGQLYRATAIDLRVGCIMDGAYVLYADGRQENCGPTRDAFNGQAHTFGGHQAEKKRIPLGATVSSVRVCKLDHGWDGVLAGIRMTLSNGEEWGALNKDADYGYNNNDDGSETEEEEDQTDVVTLEPENGDVIVGFYGTSQQGSGFTYEFGILTAPEGVELPERVYEMEELRNVV